MIKQLRVVAITLLLIALPLSSMAATRFGGSLELTSDYLVRGISRSDHDFSPQADIHAAFDSGVDVGLFAASVKIGPHQSRNTEVSAFMGYATDMSDNWHSRIALSHYSYPWNSVSARYDYDELNVDVAYQQWLTFSAMYSPNAPRFLLDRGLIGVTEKSLSIGAQLPLAKHWFATSGIGYAHLAGAYSDEYTYWGAGGIYALETVSFSLQYVDTSHGARQLYSDAAAHGRLAGTLIWHF